MKNEVQIMELHADNPMVKDLIICILETYEGGSDIINNIVEKFGFLEPTSAWEHWGCEKLIFFRNIQHNDIVYTGYLGVDNKNRPIQLIASIYNDKNERTDIYIDCKNRKRSNYTYKNK